MIKSAYALTKAVRLQGVFQEATVMGAAGPYILVAKYLKHTLNFVLFVATGLYFSFKSQLVTPFLLIVTNTFVFKKMLQIVNAFVYFYHDLLTHF